MASILIDKNTMVPMRDGVRLATDVYRLEGAAPPAPVLLARPTIRNIPSYRPAINRVFHDAAHPSRLILPIIER